MFLATMNEIDGEIMAENSETVLLFQVRNRVFSLPMAVVDEILSAVSLLPVPSSRQSEMESK